MSTLSSRNSYIKTQASTPDLANIASTAPDQDVEPVLPTTESHPSMYPDANLFSFLPDLYLIVSRLSELRISPPAIAINHGQVNSTLMQAQAQGSSTSGPIQGDSTGKDGANLTQTISRDSQLSGSGSLKQVNSSEQSIDVRDLPAQVYGIKKKIAEAREVVMSLPDIDRSVDDQEQELADLRRSIRGMQGRLNELGEIAGRGGDITMSGVEGD